MDFQLDHILYFTVLSAFQWCTGENEDFYILAVKSHPRERATEWPVFLLIIFICLFCSLCSSSEALSHQDAQQFFIADSGGTCCIAGSDGSSRRALWPWGLLEWVYVVHGLSSAAWQMTFYCCGWPKTSVCLHHCWQDLWLFITSWNRSFVNDTPQKSIILNRHCLMLIPSVSKGGVPGIKRSWLS